MKTAHYTQITLCGGCFGGLRDNGAVSYPWHGWQSGEDTDATQQYGFVAAFEINPTLIEASW